MRRAEQLFELGSLHARGAVVHAVDGDTLGVRLLENGKAETVRLIGIDTPGARSMLSRQSAAAARRLALDKHVTVKGTPRKRPATAAVDLFAYVWLPRGKDLGFQLIAGRFGKVYVMQEAARAPQCISNRREHRPQAARQPSGRAGTILPSLHPH